MAKWNASVGLQLTIDYDDIEADTKAEAIQIAKDRALEDIEWNNSDCDVDNTIVYSCYEEESEDEQSVANFIQYRNGSGDSGRKKELYEKKDFGPYAMADGRMPVCFVTATDNTGGNSGSPVFNSKGELIGVGFDRNYEGLTGDIAYNPQLQLTFDMCCLSSINMREPSI